MVLPPGFSVSEALDCGALINRAYDQFTSATSSPVGKWSLPAGYLLHDGAMFFATEKGKVLPFGFIAVKGDTAVVTIRGTETPLEWIDDASVKPVAFRHGFGNTTAGFLGLHLQIFPAIQAFLSARKSEIKKLVITGHSLGAALANLVTADLAFNGVLEAFEAKVITFCGPRTGDLEFARAFRSLGIPCWRIFNTEDLVCYLPLSTIELGNGSALGLWESKIELLLKLLFKESAPLVFCHVDEPIAVTFNVGDLPGNHDITNVCTVLAGKAL